MLLVSPLRSVLMVLTRVTCRSRLWGNTTPSGGLRKICWRSRGKELELTTRRRAWWEGRCPSWTQKVSDDRLLLLERARACTRRDTWSSCSTAVDVDSLMKKSESQHESPEDGCPFGPLTQRLLQALVEVGMLGSRVALIKKTTNYEKKRNSILCFFFFFFLNI